MAQTGKLLIVDDEEIALRNLEHIMKKEGYEVVTANTGLEALTRINADSLDILLTDLRMENVDGMQLLAACRQRHPDAEVIMITGYATTETAVQAMKEGAFHYIAKPFRLDEVRRVVAEAMEKVRLRRENQQLRQQVEAYEGRVRIITQDVQMRRLLEMARQVAPTGCNVMVVGESGTGKELFARYLHEHGGRPDGPFVAVNCGAFNEELLTNELFGNEKGAFTGAIGKAGLIETANGGTLFLDEVTEMSTDMQVKLLRVIQEREVMRVGATRSMPVDIRVIAATNRDLGQAVAGGALRQDLYFRLNVVTLHIPPLAERREDIPLLVQHFLQKSSARMKKNVTSVSPEALEALMAYSFPGNVRELENIVERGTAVTGGERIELEHLPDHLRSDGGLPYRKENGHIPTLEEQERKYIQWVMKEVGGNQTLAARMLGINRSSLWRKLKAYGDAPGN